jgi:GDP/UDP-N,N'-diacetylbacillosamine 2-epimerase (hydrolysing)
MKIASIMVGNSSSGIIEAPVFGLPVVNIGRRQIGRIQGNNIINVERFDKDEIVKAIRDAMSPEFKNQIIKISPYGDGKSAERIVQILKDIKIDDRLVNKRITY